MRYAKQKRYIRQILPFGFIWLLFGFVYVLLEYGLIGTLTHYPTTGNKYGFINSLTNTCIGGFGVGIIQGVIEVFWLKKLFRRNPFWQKFIFKSVFYFLFILFFLIGLTLISNSLLYEEPVFDPVIIESISQFVGTYAFWSVILFIVVISGLAVFYSDIEEHLGNGIIGTFLGKYHEPNQENRIFMFLDMKSSTTIAEKMGHETYFKLLKAYYADMTSAILETSGEVYQYVGDEIVVTWTEKSGLYNNNCIRCFSKISEAFEQKRDDYMSQFGRVPEFKAGLHIGEVTTGIIGIIKKDVIYTGDVLNTTARIQAECNNLNSKTLISEKLKERLQPDPTLTFHEREKMMLRGKEEPIQLFDVQYAS
ncbi:adenylate/guanylate cyclase domain-containing protein [Aureisphaera galaxeae]|uniref:adenylate/guanylate cyclase domain-containing protein n=1 Tax=Aureisphaera galaxeae TaxID=1538023 RepID=UPI00234FCE53|nr:adenylate/guanylate cyclase domain-containing protein [Aureisphaera galaxeae]MDC8004437.1 adenylate/guanylate cyclase domain-containing protein [Aureisphaera galaxeae]